MIACSGGPDSVALASIVARLAERGRCAAVLAHVNHGRRASAGQDECVALSVGERLGLPVVVARPAVGRDDEAALRDARYAALAGIAADAGAPLVLTAHTAEDQTETVLLALFRGTGLAGLAGIPERRRLADGVELIRPLLRVGRRELALELRAAALPYALDPTNEDLRYRRNALRPHLAALRRDFPHLDRAVARCAAIVAAERAAVLRLRAEPDGDPEPRREDER